MPQPACIQSCIRHTDLPGTSRLFSDFAYHFDRVNRFYRHDPHGRASFEDAAKEIRYPDERRAALVAALRDQNGDSEALTKLAQPGTVAVVTGQQVGVFSGPAYTVYKALTAVKLARRLTGDGIPAVPVFWLATEDHDFAEVDHVWMFGAAGVPQTLRVNGPSGEKQRPVGPVPVARFPVDELSALLTGLPYASDVIDAVKQAYPDGITMGEGFHRLLKTLLGKFGLLYLNPLDPAIRAIGAPFMSDALRAAPILRTLLTERNCELTDAGYHAQVHVDNKTSLFFMLENGGRATLRLKDEEYAGLANRAADVSPNALLRPVWQDFLLPTIAYVGGPGELAYLAQSEVLYMHLLGRMPVAVSRSGFTIVDARSAKLLERFKLSLPQVFTNETALKERIASSLVPRPVEKTLESALEEITRQVDRARAELLAFDPTLAAALDKSRSKIVYQMEKMRQNTAREALRRDDRAEADAMHLASAFYPHRHPQERFYSILPFLAQYGFDLIDRLHDAVELDCPDHQIYAA